MRAVRRIAHGAQQKANAEKSGGQRSSPTAGWHKLTGKRANRDKFRGTGDDRQSKKERRVHAKAYAVHGAYGRKNNCGADI